MFTENIFSYLKGYLIISVNGFFLERFINLCKSRDIKLWNLKRLGTNKIIVDIDIKDFKKLIPIVYITKTRVRIFKKNGWPFVARRIWKHKLIIAIASSFFILILVLSMFIWDIEVTGTQKVEANNVVYQLSLAGLKIGSYRKNIDPDSIRHQVVLNIPEISWLGIDIIGTRAYINVREREKDPVIIDYSTPSDIFASRAGVIQSIDVTNGTKMAKIGDTVEKGQLLVKGEQRVSDVEFIPSRAIANIKIKTWYETSKEIKYEKSEIIRHKKYAKKNTLNILGLNVNLFFTNKVPFSEFIVTENEKALSIGNFAIPIRLHTRLFQKTETNIIKFTQEEALENTKKQICECLDKQIPEHTKVVNKIFEEGTVNESEIEPENESENELEIESKNEKKTLKCTYECIEEF